MNRVMKNPLSTPAQLQMLVDGMTGNPAAMRRELGVDPVPFTVEHIRAPARACAQRLPLDLRLGRRGEGEEGQNAESGARLALLSVVGIVVMNAAFVVPAPDPWMRLVSGIALLGAIALPTAWKQRRRLFRTDAMGVIVGLATGLGLYLVARGLQQIPAMAAQNRDRHGVA